MKLSLATASNVIRMAVGIEPAIKVNTKEVGHTGTPVVRDSKTFGTSETFGVGYLGEADYNADLQGNKLYDEIDRMRKSDSIIKGAMQAIKLPILSAHWSFEPGEDTPEGKEIADWLTDQINNMNWSLKTVIRHILLYLDYGAMPFEVVFKIEDDKTFNRPMAHLRKLAPRMPRTIIEWRLDETGGLAGIVQGADYFDTAKNVPIPIENLLLFVNDLEGSNYKGISVLRAARKDYYFKDRFLRLGGIIMEKRGAGIDVGKLRNGTPAKKSEAERVLMSVRTHERAFVLENEDFDYRVEGAGAGTVLDPLPWVNYCDLSMLRGLLAEFIALGGTDAGSWALSKDKTSFFLLSLNAIAGDICEIFNRHLVKKWVDMNFSGVTAYPELRYSKLDRRDAAVVISALQALIPIGGIEIDPQLKEELRELLDLPQLPDVEVGEIDDGIPSPEEMPLPVAAKIRTSKLIDRVNWVALATGFDTAEKAIVDGVKEIQDRQIAVLTREAMKRINANKLDELDQISVPYKAEVAKVIEDALLDLYRTGQREATKEIKATFKRAGLVRLAAEALDPTKESNVTAFLSVRARTIANVLAERLRGSMLRNALDLYRTADISDDALRAALTDLSDRAIKTEAGLSISEAMNLGRDSAAKANEEVIKSAEYSCLLDETSCKPCEKEEGKKFVYGSKAMIEHQTPYKKCEGRTRCRCVLIYTLESEAEDAA